ncbi:hypothetical protein [Pseudomarimonas salicorniae]|uniref:DUF4426 domain-containing protein n=1 Tax=Pseudomarimonas salicorniae TaxID=2933270 RepID=A0ABT0GJI0_9GAMM|nr:hypothetical protein [Lysobacter sp. CAU 1642]MCK7594512.1 hypothetical protein [Lysobacter sp. CAU 1642]
MTRSSCILALFVASFAAAAPALADSCARISTFDSAPRAQQLFPAVLIAVDGDLPGPTGAPSWRITPGRHVLKVAEAIEPNRFTTTQNRERDGRRADRYKTLEIDAKPGITYRLAVRFYPDRRNPMREGRYWEPVIWKESPEPCG